MEETNKLRRKTAQLLFEILLFLLVTATTQPALSFVLLPTKHHHGITNTIQPPIASTPLIGNRHESLRSIGVAGTRSNQHGTMIIATTRTHLRLQAIPPSLWWTLGHIILGSAPVPFISSATKQNGGWLSKINRPPWNPPDTLFGPVWTVLYSCMGLAASKVYYSSKRASLVNKTPLMVLWAIHFAINVSWAPIFFSLQRFRLALGISCLMVLTLLVIIPLFYSFSPAAGFLLLPYLAWISFATVLNKELCKRNPTVKGYNNGMLQAQIQRLQENAATYANS